jgi:NAD(P)H-nitrite reductase large subunit
MDSWHFKWVSRQSVKYSLAVDCLAAADQYFGFSSIKMTTQLEERKKDIICPCSGTTRSQIMRLVDKGVVKLDEISHATGACSGCGGCDSDVMIFLADYLQSLSIQPEVKTE